MLPREKILKEVKNCPNKIPSNLARVGRNNQWALRRMCLIRCNALHLLHPTKSNRDFEFQHMVGNLLSTD